MTTYISFVFDAATAVGFAGTCYLGSKIWSRLRELKMETGPVRQMIVELVQATQEAQKAAQALNAARTSAQGLIAATSKQAELSDELRELNEVSEMLVLQLNNRAENAQRISMDLSRSLEKIAKTSKKAATEKTATPRASRAKAAASATAKPAAKTAAKTPLKAAVGQNIAPEAGSNVLSLTKAQNGRRGKNV